MGKVFSMARLNHKSKRHSQRNICVNMVVSSLLFLLITSFGLSANKLFGSYQNDNPYYREIRLSTLGENLQRKPLSDLQLTQINMIDNIEEMFVYYDLRTYNNSLKLVIDDISLNVLQLNGSDTRYSFLPKSFVYNRSNGQEVESIISGRAFDKFDTKKAVIDENYAYILGFDNVDDLIGKKIVLKVGDLILEDIEIVGVHNWILGGGNLTAPDYYSSDRIPKKLDDISDVERNVYLNDNAINRSPFILSHDIIQYVADELVATGTIKDYIGQYNIRVFTDSVINVSTVVQDIAKITANYIDSDIVGIEQRIKSIVDARLFVVVISLCLLIVSLVSVANTLIIKVQSQKDSIVLMQKMGYEKRDIVNIYILEMLFVLLKVAIIATAISLVVSIFVDMILMRTYSLFTTSRQFVFIINPILLVSYFGVLTLIVGLVSFVVIKSQMHANSVAR